MSYNHTESITTQLVTNFLSANVSNYDNHSAVVQTHQFDLFEAYSTKEREQLRAYRSIAYVFGAVIFLSNLTVVISSGLIIKKGQQPKSTYLLLGNVSLADTIVGISIIFGASVETSASSNTLCIFQMGMLVCPAMVSIFSVGMIAVDRYIYILHGLYYQRWCNTTKVRISILCIWLIGITLGFMPVTGWIGDEIVQTKCAYVSLYPGILILINSLLSIIPIILVAVLYTIILVEALKNANKINSTLKTLRVKSSNDAPEMRAYRGHGKKEASQSVKVARKLNKTTIKRSASLHTIVGHKSLRNFSEKEKSKSTDNLNNQNDNVNYKNNIINSKPPNRRMFDTRIFTVSTPTILNDSLSDLRNSPNKIAKAITHCRFRCKEKLKEPNRWRAIIIVMLTTGSFVFTWIPFFITAIFFVFCEDKMVNPKCIELRILLRGLFIASLPAMGWTGSTFTDYRCWYIAVFPPPLLIIVSLMVLSVIIMVCVLYIIILHSAVKTVDRIREFQESHTISYTNNAFNYDEQVNSSIHKMSTTTITIKISSQTITELSEKPLEMDVLADAKNERKLARKKIKNTFFKMTGLCQAKTVNTHPSKIKAVKTVLLILLCFVGTWTPYYVAIIIYVKCDITKNGYDCVPLEVLTLGPLFILGVSNSICDPIIYAWRHSGFKRTLWKIYYNFICSVKVYPI